ncbi:hypothetical protein PG990_010166 [Apiospora arundinis]
MDNIPASAEAQSDAPAAPAQALTFRAAHQPGSGRDSYGRVENQGKQTVQDESFLGDQAEPSNPEFRRPEFLDDCSPHWYQDGKVLVPDEEAEDDTDDDNGPDQSKDGDAMLPPAPYPAALDPFPWSRLDYRLQAIILKVLTRFYTGELFAFQTACEALHLDRHEADEFISRHMEEWNKQLSGRPLGSEFFSKGDVHLACKHMESQGILQGAIDIMMQYSLQNSRWPLAITTDGLSLPVDQFMSATFPSLTPSQTQSWPPDRDQNPEIPIGLVPKLDGVYHFALVPGTEGDPYGVRFTEIVIPPQALVVGPRGVHTLQRGGRYHIYYPDWCQNNINVRLSRFTLAEGRPEVVTSPLRPPERIIQGEYAALCDNHAQEHHAGPVPFHGHTNITLEDFGSASNDNRFATGVAFPAQSAYHLDATPEASRVWDSTSLSSRDPESAATLTETISQAMPEVDPETKEQQALDAMEAEDLKLWHNVKTRNFRWSEETEARTVAPKDLILPKQTPPSWEEIPGITSDELAKMPMGPVVSTSASIIRKPADYEPFLTIRLPAKYWVSDPHGQLITFDDCFGAAHGVGGVYSFHIPGAGGHLSMPVHAASSQLPEAVFARLLLPMPLALYRDDELLPRATACGYHELRKMRRVQKRDGETSEVKVTADLANQDGCYMILNDMAPYKTRITRDTAEGADESLSEPDHCSSGEEGEKEEEEEEDDDTAAAIAALESMPHHIQNAMLEAHRILGPYREQLEVEAEEELKEDIRAEKRERAREKAMVMKELKEEKMRQRLQKNANVSETLYTSASNASARSNAGQHARSSGVGIGAATGLGLGLVPFNDEVLQRQVESSSSSSSDDERTIRKKQKLADRLERIPKDDDDDETFRTKTSGRRVTKSVKAQQQGQQTPLPKRAATRAASTTTAAATAAVPKKTQTPTPVSVKRQSTAPTPASQPGTDNSSPLKRKRGRPRKHPLPDPIQPQGGSTPAPANNTQSSAEGPSASTANAPSRASNDFMSSRTLQQSATPGAIQQSVMPSILPGFAIPGGLQQLTMSRTLPGSAMPGEYQVVNTPHSSGALRNQGMIGVLQQSAMPEAIPQSSTPKKLPGSAASKALQNPAAPRALQQSAMPALGTEQQPMMESSNQANAHPGENPGAGYTVS